VSEHTVKNHLFHIFERLGISSRSELILCLLAGRKSCANERADHVFNETSVHQIKIASHSGLPRSSRPVCPIPPSPVE
jgi:hypothetical protein